MTSNIRTASGALLLALLAACQDELPEYNELEGFRVLALRASPPSLSEGQTVTLDALVFSEAGDLSDVRYAWSWCPLRLPASMGGECAVTEDEFAAQLGLPAGSVSFSLGNEETAQIPYPGSAAQLEELCANTVAEQSDLPVQLFSCAQGFPLSIRADISLNGERIRAQKDVRLLFGELSANANPTLDELSFGPKDTRRDDLTVWPDTLTPSFGLGKEYELFAGVDRSAAETYIPPPTEVDPRPEARVETLSLTWFVSSGSTDASRTTFIDGRLSLSQLGENRWALPKSGDEDADSARLFLVLRDERGGVDWLERQLELSR